MSEATVNAEFDLRDRPWILSKTRDGLRRLGLREVLATAHQIDDFEAVIPPAKSGLARVLTVLASRVCGIDDPGSGAAQWIDRRNAVLALGRFDAAAIDYYFDRYGDRFDLFHPERPWLQDPRLSQQCREPSGLGKLVFGRPGGNNQPWMSHHHDRQPVPVPAYDAAQHLIAQLYYGPPGNGTKRTVHEYSAFKMKAAPLRGLVSYYPLGRNLFESLVMAIPYPERLDAKLDAANWELDRLPDPLLVPPTPNGVGGMLAGQFGHAALLVPSADGQSVADAYLTWGWREPPGVFVDPYLIYHSNRKGDIFPLAADADRALWRDLDGLLLQDIGIANRRRPAVLDLAEHLPIELLDAMRVRAIGFDQDRAQVVDRQWYLATTPAVFNFLLDTSIAVEVSRAREAAEQIHERLTLALRNAWIAINDRSNGRGKPQRKQSDIKQNPWPSVAAVRYWPAAERIFWDAISRRDFQASATQFKTAALRAFDSTTAQAGHRPRARRAIELARRTLAKRAVAKTAQETQ